MGTFRSVPEVCSKILCSHLKIFCHDGERMFQALLLLGFIKLEFSSVNPVGRTDYFKE